MNTYQLTIEIHKDINLVVGKLGTYHFPKGTYVYTGSARRNIESRIRRHLCQHKKIRWHIDYLLANPDVNVKDVRKYDQTECLLNQKTGGDIVVKGFGSTDCHSGCKSHLKLAH